MFRSIYSTSLASSRTAKTSSLPWQRWCGPVIMYPLVLRRLGILSLQQQDIKKHQTLFQALLTHCMFEGEKVKPAKNLQKGISIQWVLDYADCLDRTSDLLITSEMRYHCAKPALIGDRWSLNCWQGISRVRERGLVHVFAFFHFSTMNICWYSMDNTLAVLERRPGALGNKQRE